MSSECVSDPTSDDGEEPFHLTPDMIAELDESIAQLDRGEGISTEKVLAELRARTARRENHDDV